MRFTGFFPTSEVPSSDFPTPYSLLPTPYSRATHDFVPQAIGNH
ncbi:hypothetical protein BJP36_42840 [Moorena producens JHB]|uniref:Uncharacterized protein n=1 Tax=Moorena producens (strain JHB) TaxID=1454205 RepID=A0A9Q9ST08_MOOP1|nr:hypothetical protein [Moorena producens]WAN69101.1 hypothetical protein BJP36_42840 [Moorena producens JHB]